MDAKVGANLLNTRDEKSAERAVLILSSETLSFLIQILKDCGAIRFLKSYLK
jgi:hypothetical protein